MRRGEEREGGGRYCQATEGVGGRHLLAPVKTAYPWSASSSGGPPRLNGGPTKVT